jgi:hypothetical protein
MVTEIIGKVLGGATTIIDKLVPDPDLAEKMKHEMSSMAMSLGFEAQKEETRAKAEIMKAELQQGDNYTKRARPTVVYAGLLFIFLNYVIFPAITFFTGRGMPQIQMPEAFWWAWSSVVGVYSIGRTVEKRKANKG